MTFIKSNLMPMKYASAACNIVDLAPHANQHKTESQWKFHTITGQINREIEQKIKHSVTCHYWDFDRQIPKFKYSKSMRLGGRTLWDQCPCVFCGTRRKYLNMYGELYFCIIWHVKHLQQQCEARWKTCWWVKGKIMEILHHVPYAWKIVRLFYFDCSWLLFQT